MKGAICRSPVNQPKDQKSRRPHHGLKYVLCFTRYHYLNQVNTGTPIHEFWDLSLFSYLVLFYVLAFCISYCKKCVCNNFDNLFISKMAQIQSATVIDVVMREVNKSEAMQYNSKFMLQMSSINFHIIQKKILKSNFQWYSYNAKLSFLSLPGVGEFLIYFLHWIKFSTNNLCNAKQISLFC